MTDLARTLIYVGIKSYVVALDARNGTEVWRRQLKRGEFVTVCWDGDALIAANSGELFRLNPATGKVLWHNEMKGLGLGLVSIASERMPVSGADTAIVTAKRQRDAEAADAEAAPG